MLGNSPKIPQLLKDKDSFQIQVCPIVKSLHIMTTDFIPAIYQLCALRKHIISLDLNSS